MDSWEGSESRLGQYQILLKLCAARQGQVHFTQGEGLLAGGLLSEKKDVCGNSGMCVGGKAECSVWLKCRS